MNGVPNIEEVSGSLIELMRGVLGNSSEFLTVREELDYVERYISIVKYRYMEPIRMVTQVEDDALLECRVLKLMPCGECRHSWYRRDGAGRARADTRMR